MIWLYERVKSGEVLAGAWLTFGSSAMAELAAWSGFDWALIDTEHSYLGMEAILPQLQAVEGTGCAPIVRVDSHDPALYKHALDLGASGVMSPMVNTAEQAEAIVRAMRYPPAGDRGFTGAGRGGKYGLDNSEYVERSNRELLTIVQIETPEAVANAEAIAAVDGVDVLFIGPADLSLSLGIYWQLEHPTFLEAVAKVKAGAEKHGKQLGFLSLVPEQLPRLIDDGFTFIANNVDSAILRNGFEAHLAAINQYR